MIIFPLVDILFTFFRVGEEEINEMMGKHLVETDEILQAGLRVKFLNHDSYFLLEGKVHRVKAPMDHDASTAVIFWTKDDEDDVVPAPHKIVSGPDPTNDTPLTIVVWRYCL